MPIFEYKCPKCGEEKEAMIFSGRDVKAIWCDNCGGTMIKIRSPPAIVYELKADHVQR